MTSRTTPERTESNVIPIFRDAMPLARVRCIDCQHIAVEYRGIDIGWCNVHAQYRAMRFKRLCEDYEASISKE